MSEETIHFFVDGIPVSAVPGQTVIKACDAAGIYIPRLCYHPELIPGGHCRLCTCKINGRFSGTCYLPAVEGMIIENDTPELTAKRRAIVEMFFVGDNHFCPSCEKSGDCELQAMAYRLGLAAPTEPYLYPTRDWDASHPEIYLDRNRCILCARCIRASRDVDKKSVFGFANRGYGTHITVNAPDERLANTDIAVTDKAVEVCPVASIVVKGTAFLVPHGERRFDKAPIGADIEARRKRG